MENRYLFRGKAKCIVGTYNFGKEDGEWVEGSLRCDCGKYTIFQFETDSADYIAYEVDPKTLPGELVNVIKTQTSRKARKLYGNTELKPYYWKPYFWSDSYFIATVSENTLEVVKSYIKDQGIK